MSTPLAELYPLYEVASDLDGPGCGTEGHAPSCYCDVDLSKSPSESDEWILPYSFELLDKAAYERDTKGTVLDMLMEAVSIKDAVASTGLRLSSAQIEALCDTYRSTLGYSADNRDRAPERHAAVVELVRCGLTLRAVVALLGRPETEVTSLFTRKAWLEGDEAAAILDACDLLAAGSDSYSSVARASGLTDKQVGRLAEQFGYEVTAVAMHNSGGGYKYGGDQLAEMRRLRSEGLSYTQIAERTGMKRKTVAEYCRRNGIAAA